MLCTLALLALVMISQAIGDSEALKNKKLLDELKAPFLDLFVDSFWYFQEKEIENDTPLKVVACSYGEGFALLHEPSNEQVHFSKLLPAIFLNEEHFRENYYSDAISFGVTTLLKEPNADVLIEALKYFPISSAHAYMLAEWMLNNAPASETLKLIQHLSLDKELKDLHKNATRLFDKQISDSEKQELLFPFFLNNPEVLDLKFPLDGPNSLSPLLKKDMAKIYLDLALFLEKNQISNCEFLKLIPALKLITTDEPTVDFSIKIDFYISCLLQFGLLKGSQEQDNEAEVFHLNYLEEIMNNPLKFPSTVNQILGPRRDLKLYEGEFLEKVVPFLNQNQCQKISTTILTENEIPFIEKIIESSTNTQNFYPLIIEIKFDILQLINPKFDNIERKNAFSQAMSTAFVKLNQQNLIQKQKLEYERELQLNTNRNHTNAGDDLSDDN
jgi:hypothetical protein